MTRKIPDNDADHPRWLLDIKAWSIHPIEEIKDRVASTGYGIVSYTWGMWADFDVPAKNVPDNLLWNVPTVKELPLAHCREVLDHTMDIRYVWWDWMCVPQGKRGKKVTLDDELEKVKGQEIAKQMAIYKGATKSVVWLHRTKWDESPRMAKYLKGDFESRPDFVDTLTEVRQCIEGIQKEEPWVTSGWTLQEGVLLEKTVLSDYYGKGLTGNFEPLNKHATVAHLSRTATALADTLSTAFLKHSQGWTSSKDMPQGTAEEVKRTLDFISASSSNYEYIVTFLSHTVRSGFVCYWSGEATPLFLLAGAHGRRFTVPEDECWALIGALELKNLNPWYSKAKNEQDKQRDLRKIKTEFFVPLLQKYQWQLLLVPVVEDPKLSAMTWPERVVHGGVLPLGLYFIQDIDEGLPTLQYDQKGDELTTGPGKFIKLKSPAFCRRYRQNSLDLQKGFVKVDRIAEENVGRHLYLPLNSIPVPDASIPELPGWKQVKEGKRCVHIELSVGETSGYFHGVVDLWGRPGAFEYIEFSTFTVYGSKS